MRILIVTGIYPPEIGGPAEYAKNVRDVWVSQGHKVSVKIFGWFRKIPWGLRHVIFFFYILPSVIRSERILALDAFSAGVVVVAAMMFSKKVIFRTGGDALWELYVERTGDLVLLREFYKTKLSKLSSKESLIFRLMKWALQNLSAIVWSTEWQKKIFMEPYELDAQQHFVVENYYGPRLPSQNFKSKNFVASTRKLKWKNLDRLKDAFKKSGVQASGAILDMSESNHDEFLRKISRSYAVVITSLGDISPNTILDAIRCGKPFIVTKETGLFERIKDIAIFVDPENVDDIAAKIAWLNDSENYRAQVEKVMDFQFTHTWDEIAQEYMAIFGSLDEKSRLLNGSR